MVLLEIVIQLKLNSSRDTFVKLNLRTENISFNFFFYVTDTPHWINSNRSYNFRPVDIKIFLWALHWNISFLKIYLCKLRHAAIWKMCDYVLIYFLTLQGNKCYKSIRFEIRVSSYLSFQLTLSKEKSFSKFLE